MSHKAYYLKICKFYNLLKQMRLFIIAPNSAQFSNKPAEQRGIFLSTFQVF